MPQTGFVYTLAGENRRIFLSGPNGSPGSYFVIVDKRFSATLEKKGDAWCLVESSRNTFPFTGADAATFGQILENGILDSMLVAFEINVWSKGRSHPVQVEMEQGKEFETFRVFGQDTLVIRGNLPMLLSKGLKKKPVTWTLLSGRIDNMSVLESVYRELEAAAREYHARKRIL